MSATPTAAPPLSATQIGKHLGLSYQGVLSLYKKGAIPAEVAEGRLYRFDLAKVRQALAERAKRHKGG